MAFKAVGAPSESSKDFKVPLLESRPVSGCRIVAQRGIK